MGKDDVLPHFHKIFTAPPYICSPSVLNSSSTTHYRQLMPDSKEHIMGLEHRWSARKQLCLEAIVFHRPLGLAQVSILNIGLEGAFIAADHLHLPVPSMVELSFALDTTGKPQIYRLNAIVLHSDHGGYGLMFKDFQLTAFRALKDMLSAA